MKIGVIKGNGIGQEITEATLLVLEATGLPFEWVPVVIGDEAIDECGHPFPQKSVQQLKELKVSIKGPFIVNKLKGRLRCVHDDGTEYVYPSLNNAIRRELNLFVCPRPIRGVPNISGKYENLNVVVMREITEDVYAGIEHSIGNQAVECVKLTTREAAVRVAEYSFNYAREQGRKKVTCVHKTNAISITDGLFLTCFREVAAHHKDIASDDCMVDAAVFYLITHPDNFDVITASNQYGDILSDVCAGLAGSMGLAPGGNVGNEYAVFAASHGAAPDIAGKEIANPSALILSGAFMLRHLDYRPW
jgi:isocitrate dehydrogenase (NAD+)